MTNGATRCSFVLSMTIVLASGACAPMVAQAHGSDPKPKTFLERENARLALLLPTSLASSFVASGYAVDDFEGTLDRGFRAGFGDAYLVGEGEVDRYLELTGLEVWYEPSWRCRVAHLRYRARLLDHDRHELRRCVGDAKAKAAAFEWDGTRSLESAVETMYEQIADHLFWAGRGGVCSGVASE